MSALPPLVDLINLCLPFPVTLGLVETWTPEQQDAAELWAATEYAGASDNDVAALPLPDFLRDYQVAAAKLALPFLEGHPQHALTIASLKSSIAANRLPSVGGDTLEQILGENLQEIVDSLIPERAAPEPEETPAQLHNEVLHLRDVVSPLQGHEGPALEILRDNLLHSEHPEVYAVGEMLQRALALGFGEDSVEHHASLYEPYVPTSLTRECGRQRQVFQALDGIEVAKIQALAVAFSNAPPDTALAAVGDLLDRALKYLAPSSAALCLSLPNSPQDFTAPPDEELVAGAASARSLTPEEVARAAVEWRLSPALIYAVAAVEGSGDGFLGDGLPKILFEKHVLWKQLKTRGIDPRPLAAARSDLCASSWRKPHDYRGGRGEYMRLWDLFTWAAKHDPDRLESYQKAAYESCSWGLFQVMGYHYKLLGHTNILTFKAAVGRNEAVHLQHFLTYLEKTGALADLRNRNWRAFTAKYNGSGQVAVYSARLEHAYATEMRRASDRAQSHGS